MKERINPKSKIPNPNNVLIIIFALMMMANAAMAQTYNLTDCVNIAISHNQSVIDAQEKVNASNAKLGESTSNFFPKLSLNASKGFNYSEPMSIILPQSMGGGSFTTGPNEASNVASYSFNVQQTLFAGGRVIMGWQIANVAYQAQKEDLRRVMNETHLSVTSAFFDLLKAQKGLEIIKSSISNMKRNVEQTQVFYDSGIGSNIDLLRAKTQLANLEIVRISAENGVQLAKLALENTLGQKLPADYKIEEPEINSDNLFNVTQEEALNLAYANRPEWREFNFAMDIAGKALNLSYGGFLPNIAYAYSYGRTKLEYPTATTNNSDLSNWKSMLVASWSLFDGFLTVSQIREGRANYNSAVAQQQNIKNAIELDVNSAYLNLKSAGEKIKASQTAADLAGRTLRTVEVSYKANIATEQNYLDSHTANQSAQLNLSSSRYDYEVAKAKLNKAIGKKII
ncbi:MAG: TolC family protein [Candidatus Margulisiibacteriota bacterium]